jgi:sulfide:quinone oxidoreductase
MFKQLTPTLAVSPQITDQDIELAAASGIKTIISNRPDGEVPGQPDAATMAAVAARHGIAFVHIPVVTGAISDADVAKMDTVLANADGPVLAFCRSGTRAAMLWALTQSGKTEPAVLLKTAADSGFDIASIAPRLRPLASSVANGTASAKVYDVVVVGGGSAGIGTAASLLKRNPKLSICVIEPSTEHYYQPGWTMVGAGVFKPEQTRRRTADFMPDSVTWINQAATGFAPDADEVMLADGSAVRYRVLVAAPGIKLDWAAIPGLSEALGVNGVTSNYRYDLAPYTYKLVQETKKGRALFSQPAMPIKCAGAPQKAMYLSCDIWRDTSVLKNIEVEFHNAGAVLFGVPTYVPALMEYINKYGVDLRFGSNLVAVDGGQRVATFESKNADGVMQRSERGFDMLHAVPPQVAPDFVRSSPLANEAGWIDVDPATLRHTKYSNIYALGDACSTSNAKTMAAARKQAPVVALNVLATLAGRQPVADYDGYGSCPLTVERGKIVLAEFGYGGKVMPSFPSWLNDGTKPTSAAWLLKAKILPQIYWHGMLKGREWMASPHMIAQRSA